MLTFINSNELSYFMKPIILAIAFLTSTCIFAFADGRITREGNQAAIKQSRTVISSRVQLLENSVKTNNATETTRLAAEVQGLLRNGMALTMHDINLAPKEDRKAINDRYLVLELASHQFNQLATNASANGSKLVEQAKTFLSKY